MGPNPPTKTAEFQGEVYSSSLSVLSASQEFVQIGIEGKYVVFGGRGLGAEDAINDVKAVFRAQGQCPDKFLPIVIRDPLVMQDIDKTPGCPVPGNFVNLCQDIHAFGDYAFENDGLCAAVFHLVEKLLGFRVQRGLIRDEVADKGIGIRKTSCRFLHGPRPPMLCLSSASSRRPA